jgi:hypothetical protein
MLTLAYFSITLLISILIWAALAAMSFWIWSATKAKASLLTMIGAILLALPELLILFGSYGDTMILGLAGAACVVFGYYLTVKPTVDAKIAAMRAHKSSTPPSSPPPA